MVLSRLSSHLKIILLTSLFVLSLLPSSIFAQNEIERARISLQGLQEFGFTANIEGSQTVTSSDTLTPSVIRQQAINQIVEAGLRFVSDEEVESSADIPFLYMHINTMQLDNGLIPFSIQLKLFQPVKLSLNRDLQTSASTWDSGMVGIVSLDRLPLINEAANSLVAEFIEDYQRANYDY
ncbi:hypothetical protein [Rhodohalobacter sp. 614A]|uniref:hypothetical protein n=1 Tax=Rhodohalobacter sp. 614A TaxID=2908649 RepID=UPI001F3CFA75|nr:hypothetical protein [Rhodohalobacter sp. 614A]